MPATGVFLMDFMITVLLGVLIHVEIGHRIFPRWRRRAVGAAASGAIRLGKINIGLF